MNKILIIALVSALAFSAIRFISFKDSSLSIRGQRDVLTFFKQFKQKFHIKYTDPDFESYRFGVFSQNLEVMKTDYDSNFDITQFMAFGLPQLMDLTPAEFSQLYLTLKVNNRNDETI